MNLVRQANDLKHLSDQQVQSVMMSGSVPAFLALSELDRRRRLRSDMQASAQPPQATVADQILGQTPQMPAGRMHGATPMAAPGIGGLPGVPAAHMQQAGLGNMQRLAAGGLVVKPGLTRALDGVRMLPPIRAYQDMGTLPGRQLALPKIDGEDLQPWLMGLRIMPEQWLEPMDASTSDATPAASLGSLPSVARGTRVMPRLNPQEADPNPEMSGTMEQFQSAYPRLTAEEALATARAMGGDDVLAGLSNTLRDQYRAAAAKKPSPWQALMALGFGMAGSGAPTFGQAVGIGGLQAIRNWQDQAAYQQRQREALAQELGVNERVRAQRLAGIGNIAVDLMQQDTARGNTAANVVESNLREMERQRNAAAIAAANRDNKLAVETLRANSRRDVARTTANKPPVVKTPTVVRGVDAEGNAVFMVAQPDEDGGVKMQEVEVVDTQGNRKQGVRTTPKPTGRAPSVAAQNREVVAKNQDDANRIYAAAGADVKKALELVKTDKTVRDRIAVTKILKQIEAKQAGPVFTITPDMLNQMRK